MSNKTGGPAFPNVPSDVQYETWDEGMTLRDYFAAKAMAAIISNSEICDSILPKINQEKVSIASYEVAALMQQTRLKPTG